MAPRIRSLLSRPAYARAARAPAPEAPKVFREFVETLQQLDAHARPPGGNGHSKKRRHEWRAGARRQSGNGHARPVRRGRMRTQ